MTISYEVLAESDIIRIRVLVNELMAYQKSVSCVHSELFDGMSYETRLVPSVKSSTHNYIMVAKNDDTIIGYVYCNVSAKESYDNAFATFFDLDSVKNAEVGCLSQFYLRDGYRNLGIGSILFDNAMEWLESFESIDDIFIFVSNGNDNALRFYLNKGFSTSHQILDGFITVLRNR